MQYVLFESPYVLVPILLVGAYACLVVWLRRRTPGAKRALLIALLLCIVLPIVQNLIVTRREMLRVVCTEMVSAADAGDVTGIAQHVAATFRAEDLDREELLDAVRRTLAHYDVQDAKLYSFKPEINGDHAVLRFAVQARVQVPDMALQLVQTTWTAEFEWIDGRWQMTTLSPRETPVFPVGSLRSLMR
ncbi:MAG: nuclear transport factor 2 family protein [Phycisphaerales bacterium]|nr:nuclear transport factor 2 family protein [Phycisphaerales bacterium]